MSYSPDLEQDFRTHRKEAIHDPERKDHRHRVDIQTQEPGQASDAQLNICADEMFVDHRKTPLHQVFEHFLVQQRAGH